mmetsp:Transcript_29372/g.40558  ORF Transcript_29372/g.40558 Transcript_29372/m.40558 type:complete len:438 (+) Transcript_29372:133-1446(+)|eukprot:CAMPEP_0201491414 /NCGR_PEP_ID=MMETSP0151_2-20130828/29735_1 /ASSEMBLY_ACC=CAM_ASM_000257 /TAXON_ID=200890 /ORGANISM="Paramoeba atlantica, Strain 621/1 / CCAP 1560/9" /LENGTH=437 /DNA_ID=CAMNT_0047877761 /DNA_START=130 /DNA_END=1443 /DNA_ORIENTATION=+
MLPRLERLRLGLQPRVRELFVQAHDQYDIYFRGFLHNHISHGLVSLAVVGASEEDIIAEYDVQKRVLEPRKLIDLGEELTKENWEKHLDHGMKASGNFLAFFDKEVPQIGFLESLKQYACHPELLQRSTGGAVHGLIHLGYACELFDKEESIANLLMSETLAMLCTTRNQFANAFGKEVLKPLAEVNAAHPLKAGENRVLTVLDEMARDEKMKSFPPLSEANKLDYVASHTDIMGKYYNMFPIEETAEGVRSAFEQIFFAATIIVFGSVPPGKQPRVDFFLVHLLTSAVSLRQILPFLDDQTGAALCRAHFIATIGWFRARGYPKLYLDHLLSRPTEKSWEELEKLYTLPAMEVHTIKALRALKLANEENWAAQALPRLLPSAKENFWLICANVLGEAINEELSMESWEKDGKLSGKNGGDLWIHSDPFSYYETPLD